MTFKNLALGTIATAPSPASSGTEFILQSGEGDFFVQPSSGGNFYATIVPPGVNPSMANSEIVLITARTTDTFTMTRAQKDTTAKDIAVDWIVFQGIYAEDIVNSASFVWNGVITGDIDGANDTFTIPVIPAEIVFLIHNRTFLTLDEDYTIVDDTITLVDIPQVGDTLRIAYQLAVPGTGNADTLDGYHASTFTTALMSGWFDSPSDWTFSSVDDPTGIISFTNADDYLSPGMRVQFTNGGNTIYGIVTVVTSTTFTFLHEIDPTDSQALYLMADSAITNPKFSSWKAPLGFPLDPRKWSVFLNNTGASEQSSPTQSTWYNLGTLSISVPIGLWDLSFSVLIETRHASSAAGTMSNQFALSTSNNSVSDTVLFTNSAFIVDAITAHYIHHKNFLRSAIAVTSKTVHYLIARRADPIGDNRLAFRGDLTPIRVVITCAYL